MEDAVQKALCHHERLEGASLRSGEAGDSAGSEHRGCSEDGEEARWGGQLVEAGLERELGRLDQMRRVWNCPTFENLSLWGKGSY